jgi:hypothetical protein
MNANPELSCHEWGGKRTVLRPLLSLFLSFSYLAFAETAVLSSAGCPVAHCDGYLSGNVNFQLPTSGSVSLVAHDSVNNGSNVGLGCVSNGAGGTVACSLGQLLGPTLVVYDASGSMKWSSTLLGPTAYASAPIIDVYGDVIAADNRIIARFDPNGNVVWKSKEPGGVPITPVIVGGSSILTAALGGPISLYSFANGSLLGTLTVTDAFGNPYDTVNTPAVNGNAVYVSLQNHNNTSIGLLAKILVNPGGAQVLTVAWTYPFGGPSGSSPHYNRDTNTVYFDGASQSQGGTGPSVLFALVDGQTGPQLKWWATLPGKIPTSVVQDPRGGIWAFAQGSQYLWRYNEADGTILQTIDVNGLIGLTNGVTNVPSSAMTITPNSVMLLGTIAFVGRAPSYVAAINLNPPTGSLAWKYLISSFAIGNKVFGQFPIVMTPSGGTNIAFSTGLSGAYFLTTAP